MEILGLEKVSFVDYEGLVCATVFTGGCNFMCSFCHNSSLVNKEQNIISEEEVLGYLSSRTKLLDAVTISGGEPTLQKDLKDFIIKVKNLGYKIKLDTNGTNPNVVEDLLKNNLIDFVAMDIKTCFNEYEKVTGVKVYWADKVQETLKILKKYNVNYELRTTLVNELHSHEAIKKMQNDLNGENLLYLQKFVDSGSCIKDNLTLVSKQKAKEFQKILSQTIKIVKLRGYN